MNFSFFKNALLICSVVILIPSCDRKPPVPPAEPPVSEGTVPEPTVRTIPQFDSQRAYQLVQKQVDFGPRVPNSKAHENTQEFLKSELQQYADTVITQSFEKELYGTNLKLTNIIGSFSPEKTNRIVLCAHWDSRPRAEEDPVPANRLMGIPGANDGGSGVAVLLELARIFKNERPDLGIDIVLFDGEDYGLPSRSEDYSLGAQYFVANMPVPRPRYAILLDIVGDRDAVFKIEGASYKAAPMLAEQIWRVGMQFGKGHFVGELAEGDVTDDHIPFIRAGIPAVDIIDIDMVGNNSPDPRRHYWHTQNDNMDNISAETLDAVGTTLLHFLFKYGNNF